MKSIRTAVIMVEGMTCSSCEARIAAALMKVEGVIEAEALLGSGTASVRYDADLASLSSLKTAIEGAGYSVKERKSFAASFLALGIGVLLIAAYLIAAGSGLFNSLPKVDASIGYGALFVIGLFTSIHCVAMCGGISLSQSIADSPRPGRLARLGPGLLYNLGRIVSYTIVGGAVGALGSVFDFSPLIKGIIAAAAGLLMLVLGLRMLGILPRLFSRRRPSASPPAPVSERVSAGLRRRGPLAIGLLNGLMPCGPLQTMQLYALGTGSALGGALSMFIFSAGTVPLMFAFGFAAAFLPRRILPILVRASAVLVIFLGAVTFARAAALSGFAFPSTEARSLPSANSQAQALALAMAASAPDSSPRSATPIATLSSGSQSVTTLFGANDYVPFIVRAGIPLKWTIHISANDINGCNGTVIVPEYRIRKRLEPGDNLVEFTPKKAGIIAYSCWMGMIRSSITVVDDIQGPPAAPEVSTLDTAPDKPAKAVAADMGIGVPIVKNGVQEITVSVDDRGYSPSEIVLQKGMKAVIKFKVGELSGCDSQVIFPEYNGGLDLAKGQLETPPISITGDFGFQCSMGMLRGYVKAVDKLSRLDLKKIKAEMARDRLASGDAGLSGGVRTGSCCSR